MATSKCENTLHVLVDMDGVVADFDHTLCEDLFVDFADKMHPDGVCYDFDRGCLMTDGEPLKRSHHEFADDLCPTLDARIEDDGFPRGDEIRKWIRAKIESPGFFKRFPLIKGAHEALTAMAKDPRIASVRFCTTPVTVVPNSDKPHQPKAEKYEWIDTHFGKRPDGTLWSRDVIMCKDKTQVRGDILIDDKPVITGAFDPTWRHVLFGNGCNYKSPTTVHMRNWREWEQAVFFSCQRGKNA